MNHTFEVNEDAKFFFTAEIKEFDGLVIDIIYKEEEKTKIEISAINSSIYQYTGYRYIQLKISSILNEGLQDIWISVTGNAVDVQCTSSTMVPVSFITQSTIKALMVTAPRLRICKES